MKKAVFFDPYGTLIDIKTDEYDPFVYEILSAKKKGRGVNSLINDKAISNKMSC